MDEAFMPPLSNTLPPTSQQQQQTPTKPVSIAKSTSSVSSTHASAAVTAAATSSPTAGLPTPTTAATTAATTATNPLPQPLPHLVETLPSTETQRHISEARAAVVASIGNMLDTELQSRAAALHDNAAGLDRQRRDVVVATDRLRRERERLAREADGAARRLKEVGNVQNWAEVLERNFLVLEETVRLAGGGGGEDAGRWEVDGEDEGEEEDGCCCDDCRGCRSEGENVDVLAEEGGGNGMDY